MSYQTYSDKLSSIRFLIEKKRANTPASIAQKIEVSERTVLRMIDFIRNTGTEIYYCKREKIYKIVG